MSLIFFQQQLPLLQLPSQEDEAEPQGSARLSPRSPKKHRPGMHQILLFKRVLLTMSNLQDRQHLIRSNTLH